MDSGAVQLSINDHIYGFDYSQFDDTVVVATSKSTQLFSTKQKGSPSCVLFHEHPFPVKQVKFQIGKGCIFSSVFNNSLTVYDPAKFTCPLLDIISPSSSVTDHDWSPSCIHALATCTNSNELFLWDTRHSKRPTHQIMVGKQCSEVQWCPWNSNLIAVSCDDRYILLWDSRMIRAGGISSNMHIVEPPGGILHFTWSQTESFLHLATGRSTVEKWHIGYDKKGCFDCYDISSSFCPPSANAKIRLVSGREGLFVCTANNLNDKNITNSNGSSISYSFELKSGVASEDIDDQTKKTNVSHSWRDLAVTERHDIVGMCWSPRTEWGGAEFSDSVLALTDSGLLQVLSPENKSPQNPDTSAHNVPAAVYTLRNSRHLQTGPGHELRISGESLSRRSSVSRSSFSSAKGALSGKLSGQVVGPLSFLSLLEDELTVLDSAMRSSNGQLEGLRIERLDQFTRRIVLEVLIPSIDSYALRNKAGSIATLSGLGHDGATSHYYRTEELHQFLKKGANPMLSTAVQVHSSCTVRSVSLIITFPVKHVAFWTPAFIIDNKANIELGGETALSAVVSELVAVCRAFTATSSAPRRSSSHMPSFSGPGSSSRSISTAATTTSSGWDENAADWLLLQLARTFRRRILRCWEKKMDSDRLSVSFGSVRQGSADNVCTSSGGLNGALLAERAAAAAAVEQSVSLGSSHSAGGEHKFVDASSSYFSSIEPLAFRVPYPTSSAGVFNCFGELVCFGSATLQTSNTHAVSAKSDLHIVDGVGKGDCHRSYATYLITTILERTESDMTLNSITSSASSSETRLADENDAAENDDMPVSGAARVPRKKAVSQDEEEDEDYQFSFDKDTTRSLLDAGAAIQSADRSSGTSFWAAPAASFEIQVSASDSLEPKIMTPLPSIRFAADSRSNASLQSYFVADLDCKAEGPSPSPFATLSIAKPVRRTSTVHEVKIQSALMGLERRLCALYSLGPLHNGSAPGSVGAKSFDVVSVRKRSEACRYNANIVQSASTESHTLVQFWNLLAVCLDVSTLPDTGGLISWNDSALGSSLFFRLLRYLRELNDLQTFAVTVCVVGGGDRVVELLKAYHCSSSSLSSSSSETTTGGADVSLDPVQLGRDIDNILYSYAQLLQHWGEKLLATEVVKHMSAPLKEDDSRSEITTAKFSIHINCFNCNKTVVAQDDETVSNSTCPSRFLWCSDCRDWAQYCSVCQSCVRGVFSVCTRCGHGGHAEHMKSWFARYDECATGCGCRCTYVKSSGGAPSHRSTNSRDSLHSETSSDYSDNDDGNYEEEDIYERGQQLHSSDSNNSINSTDKIKASVYDTYDFNSSRPHYIESVLSESNYREYNYNNFYETMQDYMLPTDSILEEDEEDDDE